MDSTSILTADLIGTIIPIIDRRTRQAKRLRAMQRDLNHPCDAVPEASRFDIEPEASEYPTSLTCLRCGQPGHLARNCFRMFPERKAVQA